MKNTMIKLVSAALLLTLTACSNGTSNAVPKATTPALPAPIETVQATPDVSSNPSQPVSPDPGAQNDEGRLVEIMIPASIFGKDADMSTFDADAYAAGMGFQSAVLNEDGSLTAVMTTQAQQELLASITAQFEKRSKAMVGAKTAPYIQSITRTDGFKTITVEVDRAAYEAADDKISPDVLGVQGLSYQVYSGDEPQVEVVFQDGDTGEVVASFTLPDDMADRR